MVLHIVRALFVLLMAAVGWYVIGDDKQPVGWLSMSMALAVGVLLICIDILAPRRKLALFAGTFFGLLVGMLMAYGLSFAVQLGVDLYASRLGAAERAALVQFLNVGVGIICCYLAISFILQTKDDFRFIVPYVEFSKQVRGNRPILVDTSVIIDGRILDLAATGVFDSRLIIPRFVLAELQTMADLGDKLKRNRGRRGLDIVSKLQDQRRIEVVIYDWTGHNSPEADGADEKLLVLARELGARVLTNDVNLAKVAQVRSVDVVSMNDLAVALRPVVLPGEKLQVKLLKPGEEPSQGVGFLDDGTMVVVEHGRPRVGEEVEFIVTNMLQTSTGRMVFGRLNSPAEPAHSRAAAT
jgi:uncharacterized protein YacL